MAVTRKSKLERPLFSTHSSIPRHDCHHNNWHPSIVVDVHKDRCTMHNTHLNVIRTHRMVKPKWDSCYRSVSRSTYLLFDKKADTPGNDSSLNCALVVCCNNSHLPFDSRASSVGNDSADWYRSYLSIRRTYSAQWSKQSVRAEIMKASRLTIFFAFLKGGSHSFTAMSNGYRCRAWFHVEFHIAESAWSKTTWDYLNDLENFYVTSTDAYFWWSSHDRWTWPLSREVNNHDLLHLKRQLSFSFEMPVDFSVRNLTFTCI
jgi:hypothetical protein